MNFDTLRDWGALIVIIIGISIVVRSQFLKEVLWASLKTIFRKKYLWFLGFFAGLVAYGGEPDLLFRDSNSFNYVRESLQGLREAFQGTQGDQFFSAVRTFLSENTWTAIGAMAVALILLAVLLWLILVAQTALIYISGRTEQKKTATLFDGIGVGAMKFWPVLSITLIMKLLTWGLWVVITGIPGIYFFINGNPTAAIIASLGSLLVSLPISIILSFLTKYAITYTTLQGYEPVIALRNAWNLFRKNWLLSIEIAIVVFALNTVAVLLVAGVAVVTIQTITGWTELISLLVILAILQGVVYAFSYATWTTAFLRMVEGRTESKLGQWTTRIVDLVQPKQNAG